MKILIVEDHVLFREMMRTVCQRDFGWEVVAETGVIADAAELAAKHHPDVVILDLQLPDGDGLDLAAKLQEQRAGCRILIVSSQCDEYTLHRVERSGVNGFLDKNTNTASALKTALSLVAAGKCYYSEGFQEARLARRRDPLNFAAILTDWECVILGHIGQALSDDEIATKLNLSPKTVMTHRSRLMRKLNISGTPKLIRYAMEHGFTRLPPNQLHVESDSS